MSVPDFRSFFDPQKVAIIGATVQPGFGFGLPRFLIKHGHGHKLRLVNPRGGEMYGLPVYRGIREVDDPVDLAVVMIPAGHVPALMEEMGAKGIRNVVLETAGFGETGPAGMALHQAAWAAAQKHGIRVIGPNCVGLVNTANKFGTVEVVDDAMRPGPLAIIAQSGVFGNILLDGLHEKGLYLSKAVTLGNRMDINECDLLLYLKDDPATKVIMIYLEGAADGPRLMQVLKEVTPHKPVIILKSGRTPAGKAATASHTGSLSGEDELYDGMFHQTGAIRAASLAELVDVALAFSLSPLPAGHRVGVLTTSGSLGALTIDTCMEAGLAPAVLSETTRSALADKAPKWMNIRNPLDIGPSGIFGLALEAILSDPAVDLVIAIPVVPYAIIHAMEQVGIKPDFWMGKIGKIKEGLPEKPLLIGAVGHSNWINTVREMSGGFAAVLSSPENAAKAAAALVRYAAWNKRKA